MHDSKTEISHGKSGMALFSGHVEYEVSPSSCRMQGIQKKQMRNSPSIGTFTHPCTNLMLLAANILKIITIQ